MSSDDGKVVDLSKMLATTADAREFFRHDGVRTVARTLIDEHPRFGFLDHHELEFCIRVAKLPEDAKVHTIAKAVKAPALWHDVAGVEGVVWVNSTAWELMDERARNAVVAHELCHFGENDGGGLTVEKHDLEEFAWVARTFGAWSSALGAMRLALAEAPDA